MSDGIDLEFVRENYQRMSDNELVRVATQDAAGLTPGAQKIVAEEIERRGLDKNIINGVQAQNRTYTIEEVDRYCEMVRELHCPGCKSSVAKLNATLVSEVMSFIFITQYRKKIKVACPDCLDKANNKALTKTAILGWWGFPWGIIRTAQAIGQNMRSKNSNHSTEPTSFLRTFVLAKVGQFETYKDNAGKLQEIISSD